MRGEKIVVFLRGFINARRKNSGFFEGLYKCEEKK